MRNILRVAFIAAVIAAVKPYLVSPRIGALPYADTSGSQRKLAGGKPAVVVLWITNCAYCSRSLAVLDEVRRLYPEQDLDVVGFYLNPADDREVDRLAAAEGHHATMARAQQSEELINDLIKGLDFRGTGRDIYVIRGDGRYVAVDASDLKAPFPGLRDDVRSVLLNKLGLHEHPSS